jgi:hypothetical protein
MQEQIGRYQAKMFVVDLQNGLFPVNFKQCFFNESLTSFAIP